MPLVALITVAAVANLNLAVANVALPDIGAAFVASQTALNLIAIGFSLGLAASVLYLGAIGDRYGRKQIMLLGVVLAVPASLVAAYSPNEWTLAAARVFGGVAAGMAFPTTLALVTALWSGNQRTRAIALWSAIGGGVSALGPLAGGLLLERFWWGSVFLITVPLAVIALILGWFFVPSHVGESTEPVDNLGGILSVVMVGSLVIAITFAPTPGATSLVAILFAVAVVAAVLFFRRQRQAANPLYDLTYAKRPIFWVAALGGMICFGSLMACMFVGQQYLQNVLGLPTAQSGAVPLAAAVGMIGVAGLSARLVERRGSRSALLSGFMFVMLACGIMLAFWTETASWEVVLLGYFALGLGIGIAGTPSSHSLTAAVPVAKAGMASATADLQRDLGGAVMQAILGALLTAGYAASFAALAAGAPQPVSADTLSQLQKSFSSAEAMATQYPQYSEAITTAAQESFLAGANWAYAAGMIAVIVGIVLVVWKFPKRDDERRLLAEYAADDPGRQVSAA